VKNVAGYDLTRLQVGAFGGFGIVTEVHLRLRAVPEADVTWIATGERDALTAAARDLMAGGVEAAAVELLSPALAARPEWLLAVRLVGPRAGVGPEADRLGRLASLPWTTLAAEAAGQLWRGAARGGLGGVAAIRMGALLDGIDETLDLLAERLDLGLVSVGAGTGAIRWSGDAAPERLLALRAALATREIPVTLERAPWPLRRAVGHFGAYREGVGPLVEGLREVFDPRRALLVPVEAPNA
jgi:FAD/FMN-containing dehydrogenase